MLVQVSSRKSLVGTGAVMAGHSLGRFGIAHPWRLRVFKLIYSQVGGSWHAAEWPKALSKHLQPVGHGSASSTLSHGCQRAWKLQSSLDMGHRIICHALHVVGCVQKFELVLFCAIAVHITVITTESGVDIQRLDHQGRKVAAQAVDVVVLVFYLCALLRSLI